jgi:hypothetical protein
MSLFINGIVYDELTSDPGSPVEGEAWYNTTDKMLRLYTSGETREAVVTFGTPSSGDVPIWSGANSRWEPGAAGGGFPLEFEYASDATISSTTGITYLEKLKLTTAVLPAGDYRVEWYAECECPNSFAIVLKIEQDDTDLLSEVAFQPTQSTGFSPFLGWDKRTLTNASHTFDLDFKAAQTNKQVNIQEARLALWRVA